jgi:hypothetical protein
LPETAIPGGSLVGEMVAGFVIILFVRRTMVSFTSGYTSQRGRGAWRCVIDVAGHA